MDRVTADEDELKYRAVCRLGRVLELQNSSVELSMAVAQRRRMISWTSQQAENDPARFCV